MATHQRKQHRHTSSTTGRRRGRHCSLGEKSSRSLTRDNALGGRDATAAARANPTAGPTTLETGPPADQHGSPADHATQEAPPAQQTRTAGPQPSHDPRAPWGYYPGQYDPDDDPWNDVNQPDATAAQHPATPEGGGRTQATRQPAHHTHVVATHTHTPPPASHAHPRRHLPQLQPQSHLQYAVPPDVNQWGYTLIYHPPLGSPAATTTTAHTVTPAAPLCPQPPQDQDTCDPQPVCDRPSKPLQQQQRTTASTTPQRAPQPPDASSQEPHQEPNKLQQAAMRQHMRQNPTPANTPTASDSRRQEQAANDQDDTTRRPSPTTHTRSRRQQGGEGRPPTDDHGSMAPDTATQPPPTHQSPATAVTAASEGARQRGGQGAVNTQQPAAATAAGSAAPEPWQELEEHSAGGGAGSATQPKPYHEGHGDQRMRGKRFEAAVQTAFQQRGWHKLEEQTWREVAHYVGLREEDDEDEWARVLARGANQHRGTRMGADASPSRAKPPHAKQAATSTNFAELLNKHLLPWDTTGNPGQAQTGGGTSSTGHGGGSSSSHERPHAPAHASGAQATVAEGSTLNPNYWQTQQRGYTRARQSRQQTAPDPSG